ncbi:hypothetical protein [Candidatus Formimonas warabiya]|uniref:Uncharacterized protein n=1 Tax=Formimonas warabiya TaxID=1761012 RepID=A0A3G1KWJ5_FORW1|nr:hypothetical protein [Candidatus Formimonas warabiya]ATW26822.1 hypothetical protein DCMF_20470 [Candidatus Formimonas warabiya]
MKNPFTNILNTRGKRNSAVVALTVVLAVAILGTLVSRNVPKTSDEPGNTPPDMAALRGEYFDFAIKHRLDYIPFFEEGKAPTDSTEYLFWAFAVNLDNWGEDKGTMTRVYVDTAIHDHFEVGEIAHASMWKGWDYDGEKYVAVPGSISDKPVYALREYSADVIDKRTVYTITLAQCAYTTYPPSVEDMANYRTAIVSGDLSKLSVTRTETFRFYLNEETGEPVFLSHTLSPAQAFFENTGSSQPLTEGISSREKYYDYFAGHSRQVNPLFAIPNEEENALNANLMIFAFRNLEAADFQKGSTREEIDDILNKYFGRTVGEYITPYSEGLENGNVAPTAWSFHGCNRLVLTRLSAEDNGSFTGVFDVYEIPEGEENLAAIDKALREGDTGRYQSYFSQSATINWYEIEDESEPQGFYMRYNYIIPGKAQDWGISKGMSEGQVPLTPFLRLMRFVLTFG